MTTGNASARIPNVCTPNGPTLVFVGGKGGVGKTSIACTVARSRAASDPHAQHLIISTDPAHSTADAIAETGAPTNLHVLEFDPEAAHAKFLEANAIHLKAIATRARSSTMRMLTHFSICPYPAWTNSWRSIRSRRSTGQGGPPPSPSRVRLLRAGPDRGVPC